MFPFWKKGDFEPVGKCVSSAEFMTSRNTLLIFLPFYLWMLIMQILTETDNHKCRNSVTTKKSKIFKKMSLKFRNSKFKIFCEVYNIYFLYKIETPWSSEGNKTIQEQVKAKAGLQLYPSIFLRNKNYVNKISSRNSTLYKFLFKIYLESLSLYYSFAIMYKRIFENLNITFFHQ